MRYQAWPIFILAFPGVVLGTLLTSGFALYVLPYFGYGGDWTLSAPGSSSQNGTVLFYVDRSR